MDTLNESTLPEVAVVILNWNGRSYLERFLPFVLSSTYGNMRVIVADNASTDNSVAMLQEKFPSVEIIVNSENEGFAKGYNTALRQINSPYYVLLNSDVEVTPGWIKNIITLMERDLRIAACQPKILSYNQKSNFEYAGACGGWIDRFGYPFARGRVFEYCEKDEGQYDTAEECFWASGAAMFLRASAFREAGG
ncbi:MAG: glycosyltransferase, partial [Chitinophagaceae bacterium]